MKKYSTDYFEKKYKILYERLLQKDGFIDEIKEIRKKLKIPEDGFDGLQDFAEFLIKKMTKTQKENLTFFTFLDIYAVKNKICITEENRDEAIESFIKEGYEDGISMMAMMFSLIEKIDNHHSLITEQPLFKENKKLSDFSPSVKSLIKKYWSVDLLDDHVILNYVERYLLMGETGVNGYIKNKLSCHNCKYLGIGNFSPNRNHMDGQDEGIYSKKYLFNKDTVRMLSMYFDSVFVIIKPYATKQMMLQYIDENWDDLKASLIEKNKFYKQFDVKPSVIRKSDDEKNRLIYELNKLSKKDLLIRYKGEEDFSLSGIYKERIVSAILKEEYSIDMTSDAVKKSASRFAKSIKIQKEPKDIGDI